MVTWFECTFRGTLKKTKTKDRGHVTFYISQEHNQVGSKMFGYEFVKHLL